MAKYEVTPAAGVEQDAEKRKLPPDIKEDLLGLHQEIGQEVESAERLGAEDGRQHLDKARSLKEELARRIEILKAGKVEYESDEADKERLKQILERDFASGNAEGFFRHGATIAEIDWSIPEAFKGRKEYSRFVEKAAKTLRQKYEFISQGTDEAILEYLELISNSFRVEQPDLNDLVQLRQDISDGISSRVGKMKYPFPFYKGIFYLLRLEHSRFLTIPPDTRRIMNGSANIPKVEKAIKDKWQKGFFDEAIARMTYVKHFIPEEDWERISGAQKVFFGKYRLYKKLLSSREQEDSNQFIKALGAIKTLEKWESEKRGQAVLDNI